MSAKVTDCQLGSIFTGQTMSHFSATGAHQSAQLTHADLPTPRRHSMSIRAVSAAVPVTRRAVSHVLTEWGLHDRGIKDTLLLVMSELLTNALRHTNHARPGIRVMLHADRGGLRLGVADNGPGTPASRQTSPSAENGRGLAIVEALTGEWGGAVVVEHHLGGGKTVWAGFPALSTAGVDPLPG
ncbi:ATP-binding protein [Streptomyces galbus]|uniref:ATP-binding protein n=1 Tax=Streptomyces galbus TaxID=33898 RepID=UPI003804DB8F